MNRFTFLFLLLLPIVGHAITLTSDKLDANATYVDVKVDGTVVTDCGAIETPCIAPIPGGGGNAIAYDITRFAGTGEDVTIEARSCNTTGLCSIWSQPYVADLTPPGVPEGLKIIVKVVVVTN